MCPEGARLVAALHAEGGWPPVLALVGAPPESTEQILHRAKLGVDFPTHVALPAWPEERLGPATLIARETVGELGLLRLLLEAGLDAEAAHRVATGWDGDALGILRTASGDEVVLWRIVWDREEDAHQFRRAFEDRGREGGLMVAVHGRLAHAVRAPAGLREPLRDLLGGEASPPVQAEDAASTEAAEADGS